MNNYFKSWYKLINESNDRFYLKKCLKVENLDSKIINKINKRLSELN